MGSHTTTGQQPLTTEGETQAWEAGLRTYELDAGRLAWRDHWRVQDAPASTVNVYPQHRCWAALDTRPIDAPAHGSPGAWPGQDDNPPYQEDTND